MAHPNRQHIVLDGKRVIAAGSGDLLGYIKLRKKGDGERFFEMGPKFGKYNWRAKQLRRLAQLVEMTSDEPFEIRFDD